MKAWILISTFAAALVMVCSNAEAGKRGHGQHGHVHGSPPHYGYATPHSRHRYGKRHHHDRHHAHGYGALAGAVLLGTIVTTLNQPRPAGVIVSGPAYAVRDPYRVNRNIWYQRDVNGDCFEVRLQHGGTQLWTQTHPRHCR
jgi:hypothetical protein